MTTTNVTEQRANLVDEVEFTDGDAFPGSKAWQEHQDALRALAAFDAAHPEILAAAQAEHADEMADHYQD